MCPSRQKEMGLLLHPLREIFLQLNLAMHNESLKYAMLSQQPDLQNIFFPKKLSKTCQRQEHTVTDYTLSPLGARIEVRRPGLGSQQTLILYIRHVIGASVSSISCKQEVDNNYCLWLVRGLGEIKHINILNSSPDTALSTFCILFLAQRWKPL